MITLAPQKSVADALALPEMSTVAVRKTLKAGETLWVQGDQNKFFFFIHSGLVKLTSSSGTGRDVITEFLFEGDVCGALCALDCHPYPTTAACVQDTDVSIVPTAAFHQLAERHPEVMVSSARCCQTKMRFQREMMVGMAVERAEQRAARALLMLAGRLGERIPGGLRLRMPLSRQEFSELVGTTVETAIRVLSRFRKQGLLEEKSDVMILRDEAQLMRMATAA